MKVFYKKNKHSVICCNYLWKEEAVAFVCFERVITTCFKKYAHRDFTFIRNEKKASGYRANHP